LHTGEVILENKVRTDDVHQFSYRELEIMRMLKEGKTSETIAERLFISRHTVDTHRRNMLLKTGCKSTIELIHQATQLGIL
jgi:DNA-binding CsgD family transcriptional regulator